MNIPKHPQDSNRIQYMDLYLRHINNIEIWDTRHYCGVCKFFWVKREIEPCKSCENVKDHPYWEWRLKLCGVCKIWIMQGKLPYPIQTNKFQIM